MNRILTAMAAALTCAIASGAALAQTPASGENVPDAAAVQCVSIVPTGTDIIIQNNCSYRIAVAVCVPRNAPSRVLCKPENGSDDISAKTLYISPRGNIGTNFPNGSSIYQMACRATTKPVLISATSGECLQP